MMTFMFAIFLMMFFVLLSMLFCKWFPSAAKFITAGFVVISIFIWVDLQDVNYKSKKKLTKIVSNQEITETISNDITIQTDPAQVPKTFEGENLTPKQKLYNEMITEAKLIAHADFEQSKKDSKDLYAMQGNTMALGNESADMFLAKHKIKHVEASKADFMSAYSEVYNKLASEKYSFTETNKIINTVNPDRKDGSNDSKRIAFIEHARRELEGEYTNGLRNEKYFIPESPEELVFIAEQLAIDENTNKRSYRTLSTQSENAEMRIETEMMDSVCPCTVAEVLALRVMRRERGFTDSVAKIQQVLIDKPPGWTEEGFNKIRNSAAKLPAQIESIIKVKEAFKATHPKVSLTQYGEVIPYQGVPNKKYNDAVLAREYNRQVHKINPYYH